MRSTLRQTNVGIRGPKWFCEINPRLKIWEVYENAGLSFKNDQRRAEQLSMVVADDFRCCQNCKEIWILLTFSQKGTCGTYSRWLIFEKRAHIPRDFYCIRKCRDKFPHITNLGAQEWQHLRKVLIYPRNLGFADIVVLGESSSHHLSKPGHLSDTRLLMLHARMQACKNSLTQTETPICKCTRTYACEYMRPRMHARATERRANACARPRRGHMKGVPSTRQAMRSMWENLCGPHTRSHRWDPLLAQYLLSTASMQTAESRST